ncbi:MAG: sodium:solute symporter family protein [Bacteroidales bacterium]
MHVLDYIVLLIFSLIIVLAGMSFARSGKNLISFFAGGGSVPWGISGLSLFMSFFSAGTFVVWGSIAYDLGWVSVTIQWTMCIGGILVGLVLAPRWKKAGILTAAEFLTRRFNLKTQKFYTWIFLLVSLFTSGNFLYPVAKIVSVSTGFSLYWIIIILGLSIILYTTAGGFWAVLITDVLQFIVLFSCVLVVIPLTLKMTGGVNGLSAKAPDEFFKLFSGEFTPWFIFAFFIYNTIFIGGNWAYVQRFTSVKDGRAARKSGLLFGLLYLISPVIWMLPPIAYRVINPGVVGLESEGAYIMMCKQVLPIGMLGLMLASMVFATASSVNTTLNMSAAVVTNDLYKTRYPNASAKETMRFARMITVVFGLGAVAVAMMVPGMGGIVEAVLSVGAIAGVPLLAPPIWALFSKRISGKDIVSVTIISLVINLFFKFITPWLFDLKFDRATEMAVGTIVPMGMLLILEIWAALDGKISHQYIVYLNKLSEHTSVHVSTMEKDSRDENTYAFRVLGFTLLVLGLLIGGLGIMAGEGRVYVLIISMLIISGGIWLRVRAS